MGGGFGVRVEGCGTPVYYFKCIDRNYKNFLREGGPIFQSFVYPQVKSVTAENSGYCRAGNIWPTRSSPTTVSYRHPSSLHTYGKTEPLKVGPGEGGAIVGIKNVHAETVNSYKSSSGAGGGKREKKFWCRYIGKRRANTAAAVLRELSVCIHQGGVAQHVGFAMSTFLCVGRGMPRSRGVHDPCARGGVATAVKTCRHQLSNTSIRPFATALTCPGKRLLDTECIESSVVLEQLKRDRRDVVDLVDASLFTLLSNYATPVLP